MVSRRRETFVGEPGDGPIVTEVLGHQLEAQHNFSDNWSLLAGLGYRDTSFEGNASETNFGGRQTYFLDGRTLSRFFRYRNFESEYFVARAEVAGDFSSGSVRHRLLVGADYDRFDLNWFIQRYRPRWFPGSTDINTLDPAAYLFLDVFQSGLRSVSATGARAKHQSGRKPGWIRLLHTGPDRHHGSAAGSPGLALGPTSSRI